jgi:hypothetical protein
LKKTSLGPLRQGQRLDTSETKLCSSQEHKPPNQSSKTTKSSPCTLASSPQRAPPAHMEAPHKELPLHTCKLPLNQCNSPWTNACKPLDENRELHQLSSDRSDQSPSPVRPVGKIAQHLRTTPVRPMPFTGQADAS